MAQSLKCQRSYREPTRRRKKRTQRLEVVDVARVHDTGALRGERTNDCINRRMDLANGNACEFHRLIRGWLDEHASRERVALLGFGRSSPPFRYGDELAEPNSTRASALLEP